MYKNLIPAEVIARQARTNEPTHKMADWVRRNDGFAAQMSEAASNYTVALQRELAAEEERCVRLAANFENFKRRTAQEMDKRAAEQRDALVRDLLPVIDNLERAVASASSVSLGRMYAGIRIIGQQLIQVLRRHGFEMRSDSKKARNPSMCRSS
jgi:molecular chaperone GrpE